MDAQTPDTLLNADLGPALIDLTADVVSAYVTNNTVAAGDLPGLIASVHRALAGLDAPELAEEPAGVDRPTKAQVRASITPDYIVSFEDGQRYKTLKRHLTGRGISPDQYRQKHGLPSDYPMVAPAYAAWRSELARSMGLGQQRRKHGQTPAAQAEAPPEPAPAEPVKKPRARKAAAPASA